MSWIRDVMYARLRPTVEAFAPGRLLLLGGASELTHFLPKEVFVEETDFPVVDMERTSYGDESWDYIISDQALEHIRRPWKAVAEIHRILRKGGLVICTTCAFNPVHYYPIDCYRFLPQGLEALFEDFDEVATGAWGSRAAMIQDILRPDFRDRAEAQEKELCKIHDDADTHPWVTWVIAKR
jgi:SAM-dependent methyltransferase